MKKWLLGMSVGVCLTMVFGLITVNAESGNEWNDAYRFFVTQEAYEFWDEWETGQGGTSIIAFALHDMDGNRVPELLIYNGGLSADFHTYVWTYKEQAVTLCGTVSASSLGEGYCNVSNDRTYPGLFTGWWRGGSGTYMYHFLKNGSVVEEVFMEDNMGNQPEEAYKEFIVSKDMNLYRAYKNSRDLKFFTLTEIRSMGWDAFVKNYWNPGEFSDVSANAWYFNDVKKAVDTGLINGYEDGTYRPDRNMTYAEAVKLAAVMHKLAATGSSEFQSGSPWYQPYVDYAKRNGIISKDYDWNKAATRAGYMEIFANAIPDRPTGGGIKSLTAMNTVVDGSIPDVSMNHPQAAAIYKLYRAGILQGSDDQHNCKPNSNIRRSEVAAILTRMMSAGERICFSM